MLENTFILNEIIKSNKALVNLRDPVSNAVPLHFSVNSNSLECTSLLLVNIYFDIFIGKWGID